MTSSPPDRGASDPEAVLDPLSLETQVCFALSAAARALVAIYRPILEPLRLTHPQYLVMLALWESGPLSGAELAGLVHLDPGTLSPLVARLEALGYVRKSRSVDDARVMSISLTTAGRALREQAKDVPAQVVERTGMSVDELTQVRLAADRVVAAGRQAGVLG
ncbi:MarR family transcriptional regulator [Sanguibacter sp. 25GB23B1]|uniref:MarR family winged helix-turn-helix transcriptional regulator n=1 Tax=unclassified Sanguibacter TaxID=2645534 RepID=UPI0032AFD0EB